MQKDVNVSLAADEIEALLDRALDAKKTYRRRISDGKVLVYRGNPTRYYHRTVYLTMTFILEKKPEYTAVHWYIPGPDKWLEPGRAYSKKIEKILAEYLI